MNTFKLLVLIIVLGIISIIDAQQFSMTGIIQLPSPQAGITQENTTVELYGLGSSKWTISELLLGDEVVCLFPSGSESCANHANRSMGVEVDNTF